MTITCSTDDAPIAAVPFDRAYNDAVTELQTARHTRCVLDTSSEEFNIWLNRTTADLSSYPDLVVIYLGSIAGPPPSSTAVAWVSLLLWALVPWIAW